MMNHSWLRLLLFAIAFSVCSASGTAQELAGKTFVAGNGATCKEMSDGGCMIYYYRVLEFSADSVRVSQRTDANCTHPEREAMYEHLHDKLTKSYKWTASDGIVTLEHCPEFEHLSLKDGYLMGTLTTEYEKRELLFKEEEKRIAQPFEQTFSGQWAMTFWKFEFHKDGTYKRTSSGHYGNPVFTGTYSIQSDTIHILSGNESSGTVSEYYLLDKDSMLIDLDNFYDYTPGEQVFYLSRKRYDILKQPDMDTKIVVTKAQLDSMIGESTDALKKGMSELTDKEHIQIIRLINTIQMSRDELPEDAYAAFLQAVSTSGYEQEVAVRYDWIPNRGMGYYFQKLQVELGGTPHFYSRFTIE